MYLLITLNGFFDQYLCIAYIPVYDLGDSVMTTGHFVLLACLIVYR